MCLCRSERTSFTNGNLKGSINAGRYTADYLQCGNLPYLAWKNAHNCAGLSYRRIRRYLVWRLKRLEARDFSRVRIKFLIHGIFVYDEMQSCGIGKLLLDYIKNKKVRLRLNVYQKNTRALSFYQREEFNIQCEGFDGATGEKEYPMLWQQK